MIEPAVEVVIAVHSPRREVTRAVRSVLDGAKVDALVTVVCHGYPKEAFPELLEFAASKPSSVRILEFSDGIPSPAGPFNFGLEAAVAPYVAIMGSDDTLERGALDAWYSLARQTNADFVFAGIVHQDGTNVTNPRVRPFRVTNLDPRKDRLFERSAPLGLMRTALLRARGMRLAEGLVTGEDIEFTTELIVGARQLATGRRLPKYTIGVDAHDRVTAQHYTVSEMLEPVWRIIDSAWFPDAAPKMKASIMTARLRIAVLATVAQRQSPEQWTEADIEATHEILQWISTEVPVAFHPLPRSNRHFIDVLLREKCTSADAAAAARSLASAGRAATMLPRRLRHTLHRDGTIARYAGYTLNRFGA